MELPFGKKISVGPFTVLKYSKSLSKKEVKELRDAANIPTDVRKHLQRGSLPFIKVETVSGSWSVEWIIGQTMYDAINKIPLACDADGNPLYFGNGFKNLHAIFNAMFADTCTVGDFEYQQAKQKLLVDYLNRASAVQKEQTEEEKKESEEALEDVYQAEQHKAMILEMGKEVKNADERK